jgi:hypothetical protein
MWDLILFRKLITNRLRPSVNWSGQVVLPAPA